MKTTMRLVVVPEGCGEKFEFYTNEKARDFVRRVFADAEGVTFKVTKYFGKSDKSRLSRCYVTI